MLKVGREARRMNILLGYASGISREFAQLHLGRNYADLHITTAGSFDDCLELVKDFQTLDYLALDIALWLVFLKEY